MKKKITFSLLAVFTSLYIFSQDITGQWNGMLEVQGIKLRIVFNITQTDSGYISTMDSPDQSANGIHVSSTSFENPILNLKVLNAGIEYEGELKENAFIGTFKQGGLSLPLDLKREKIEKVKMIRPQDPVEPYPYYSQEVSFTNDKANLKLAGTLTLPHKQGRYPVAVLITGSGPQNRDEELLGHKPFLVISDYLTRNGIAVLRYDDRGTAQSEGDFKTATSQDFASDVEAAISYLKTRTDIDKSKIGLIGHSEGGIIAPMVASGSKDVNFIVLLAGTGIRGDKLLLMQQELIGRASGVSETDLQRAKEINRYAFDLVVNSTDIEKLKADLTDFIKQRIKDLPESEKPKGISEDEYISSQVNQLTSPWMLYFLKYDPARTLQKVKCPVLAINGEKDLQVPAVENLEAIKIALQKGGNKNVTVKELPGLNHLFQECKTGLPAEYSQIEQTFSPVALEKITTWILNQVK